MNDINLKQIITGRFRNSINIYPVFIQNLFVSILNRLMHIDEINNILQANQNNYGFDFIDEFFEYLDFTYKVSYKDKIKIPAEGKLIVVANHPLGGLDGLALLKTISEIRKDVKIVANDILLNIGNLSSLFLPYDIFSPVNRLRQIKEIEKSLQNEEAVIFFPASEVSRITPKGVRDKKWLNGPIKLSKKMNAPILPVFIEAQNTKLFYLISLINKNISLFFLTREMFKKKNSEINIKISDPIPSSVFSSNIIEPKVMTGLLKTHIYRIGKGKSGVFKTEKNIIHPISIKDIRTELYQNKLIGTTLDNKSIFLVENENSENILREISRLREITFRKVGEGTGKKADLDSYDNYYKHIVLWDDRTLDIVGSYRLGLGSEILNKHGFTGFYTYNQFLFSSNFVEHIEQGVELGRSFIQQKYWKSAALDYLWQGIGAFLREYPNVRYLFGTVSISDSYSDFAKELIVSYYKKWYNFGSNLCISKNKFLISRQAEEDIAKILTGNNPDIDFRIMKDTLKNFGFSVPVLYRRYTEICDFGGVEFLDFGVDKSFGNSIDGFIIVDLSMIKQEKKQRYYL